jgi:hypothetical protein
MDFMIGFLKWTVDSGTECWNTPKIENIFAFFSSHSIHVVHRASGKGEHIADLAAKREKKES